MLNKKIIIYFIIIMASVFIPARNIFAQGLDIGGNVAFTYTAADSNTKDQTLQDSRESFTHNYSYGLNIKNDLTDKGSFRSALRYSITEGVSAKAEITDVAFDVSYDKIACSLTLTDDTNSEYEVGVTNSKSNNFNFSINPDVLPRFTFNYANSITDSQLTTTSDNTIGVQLTKDFKTPDANIMSAVSFNSNSSNSDEDPTVKQKTDSRLNLSYNTRILSDKLTLTTTYLLGNAYDVGTAVNNMTESGNTNFSYNIIENLTLNADWTKNKSFNSSIGKTDITNSNSFRLSFSPIKNLSFATSVKFSESQNEGAIDGTSSRDFTVRIPPILKIINVGYSYNSQSSKSSISANNNINLSVAPGSLNVSNFTAGASYGTSRQHSIENNNAAEAENFGFNLAAKLIDNLSCSYAYNLDKNSSMITDDNKESIKNSITLMYNLQIIEDLYGSFNTSYDHTQGVSSTVSSDMTTNSANASLSYKLGLTSVSLAGSANRSFDETGTHLSQRTDFGPGINTVFLGIPLSANLSVGTDSKDGELASTNNTNYSLSANYPLGTKGTSTFTYTATKQENLSDESMNANNENISINVSFTF